MAVFWSTQLKAQLAKDKCKFLGNVIGGSLPADFNNYWNQVTPENSGKWGSVESTRDVMSWNGLDLAYNTAVNNSVSFKQHTLVWGQQQPGWISALPALEQREEVEEWIKSFCERYPETDFIDVVNEPLHAVPDYATALGETGSTGWDWVIWSFEKARQYCPNANLILNDYNIISNDAATNSYITIINLLKERELIDIIGEQGHFLETTPVNTIKKNLDKLQATGLPVHISEYDVNIADDHLQNEKYKEQFPVLWEHPGVHGITLWGYRQGQIWRENSYLIRTNGTARPAMNWLSSYVDTNKGGTFCDPVTGMLEDDSRMDIFPSPATDGTFTMNLGQGVFEVKILDLYGKIKKEMSVSANQPLIVQLNEPAGMYFLQVHDGRQTICKKILLN
ncbi:MAG: endo-1,4-beta-xylanase [Cyclobacteriaceae bacterium]